MAGELQTSLAAVTLVAALTFFIPAGNAHAIRISINNDLSTDEGGETLEIEEATSVEAPKNKIRFSILPGEVKELTGGNVTYFILNRVFPRHKLRYEIQCDPNSKGEAVLTLQDVHEGSNLPSACRITRRGHWSKRTGMNWDE